MLTLKQLGERIGFVSRPYGINSVAEVFGIFKNYTFKELNNAAEQVDIPKPFYLIGHNTNSIADVKEALARGANAVEIDINVYKNRDTLLCVSEDGNLSKGGDDNSPEISDFLKQLHQVAIDNPEDLALVIFDCKPKMATAQLGTTLLQLIRNFLTFDNELNIIMSVASIAEGEIFSEIKNSIGRREGFMVDEENDPEAVSNMLSPISNRCYGNGVAHLFQSPTLSPHVRPSIEHACSLRGVLGDIKFVYTWSLGDTDSMREYIRIGVNGIIPGKHPSTFDADAVATLRAVVSEPEFRSIVRLASRQENPFERPDTCYVLQIKTGTRHNAGTDANVTFTLTGILGSVSKTVDTSLIGSLLGKTSGRMENNSLDFVNVQSLNLGHLLSITVQRDNKGNAPSWDLDFILVGSFRYNASTQANFQHWIETTSPFTVSLT